MIIIEIYTLIWLVSAAFSRKELEFGEAGAPWTEGSWYVRLGLLILAPPIAALIKLDDAHNSRKKKTNGNPRR